MKRTFFLAIIITGIGILTSCGHNNIPANNTGNDNIPTNNIGNNNTDNSNSDTILKSPGEETPNIHNIYTSIDTSIQNIIDKNYDNLDLSNATAYFPDIEEYHNLRLYKDSDITIDEMVINVRKMVETYFPKHQYSEDNLFYWGMPDGSPSYEVYPDGWSKYPKVVGNKEAIVKAGIQNAFIYESDAAGKNENDAYFLINPYTLAGTCVKGTGKSITQGDYEHLAGWFPDYTYEYIERYNVNNVPDKIYKLYDREASLPESLAFAVDFFENNYLPSSINTQITTDVAAIEVRRCDNADNISIYGYQFLLKNIFEKIAFDYSFDLGTISPMSDGKDYMPQTNKAFMAKSNDIDFWYMMQPFAKVEWDGEAITHIISLEDAIETISEKLTKSVKFKVVSIDFVYCPLAFEGDSRVTTAEAAWKMEAQNPNDGKYYIVYVDAVNGKLRYYTKVI